MQQQRSSYEFDDLSREEQLTALLERSKTEPVIIYKHSNICGLSLVAQREVRKYAAQATAPIYKIVVQKAGVVSDAVERLLGIRHESPQAILVTNGKAVFDASHRRITARALSGAVEQHALRDG